MKNSSSDATVGDLDKKTTTLIESIARQVRIDIDGGKLPDISFRFAVLTMLCTMRRRAISSSATHARCAR